MTKKVPPEETFSKKIALLVNGALRLPIERHLECLEGYKQLFVGYSVDIWYFTWQQSPGTYPDILLPHVFRLFALPEPTTSMLDDMGIPFCQQLVRHPEHAVVRTGNYAVAYGIGYLLNEIEKSGIQYDYVCRVRNDLKFLPVKGTSPGTWVQELTVKPNLYILPDLVWLGSREPGMLNDHFAFGTYELIKKVWSWDLQQFCETLKASWNFEEYTGKVVARAGGQVQEFPVEHYTLFRREPSMDWKIVQ